MSERQTGERARGTILTDDDLAAVVGGSGDLSDPVGPSAGQIDVDSKATPIIFP